MEGNFNFQENIPRTFQNNNFINSQIQFYSKNQQKSITFKFDDNSFIDSEHIQNNQDNLDFLSCQCTPLQIDSCLQTSQQKSDNLVEQFLDKAPMISFAKNESSFHISGNIKNQQSLEKSTQQKQFQESSDIVSKNEKLYKSSIQSNSNSKKHKEQILIGSKIISALQKNIVSLPFREPINPYQLNIPDYLQIIKHPMDLRTIKQKIGDDEYLSVDQICSDIQLIISNSFKYNQFNPQFLKLTKNFQKYYLKSKRDCFRILKKNKTEETKNQIKKYQNSKCKGGKGSESNNYQTKNRKETSLQQMGQEVQTNFTIQDLLPLAKEIRKLSPTEQIQLFKKIGIQNTLTIDLKILSDRQLRGLFKQLKIVNEQKQYIQRQAKKQNSAFTCQSTDQQLVN